MQQDGRKAQVRQLYVSTTIVRDFQEQMLFFREETHASLALHHLIICKFGCSQLLRLASYRKHDKQTY